MKRKFKNADSIQVGNHELDPCLYEEVETVENCTVYILKCKNCGHIEIEWEREKKGRTF